MQTKNMIKSLADAGITATTDGLLRDFVTRGMYRAAIDAIDVAIQRRYNDAVFLEAFKATLAAEILEDEEV